MWEATENDRGIDGLQCWQRLSKAYEQLRGGLPVYIHGNGCILGSLCYFGSCHPGVCQPVDGILWLSDFRIASTQEQRQGRDRQIHLLEPMRNSLWAFSEGWRCLDTPPCPQNPFVGMWEDTTVWKYEGNTGRGAHD